MHPALADQPQPQCAALHFGHHSDLIAEVHRVAVFALGRHGDAAGQVAGQFVLHGLPVRRVVDVAHDVHVAGAGRPGTGLGGGGWRRMGEAPRHAAFTRVSPDFIEEIRQRRQPPARLIHRRPQHRRLQPAATAATRRGPALRPAWADAAAEGDVRDPLEVARPPLNRDRCPPHHPGDRLRDHPRVHAVVGRHVLEVAGQGVEPETAVLVGVAQPDQPAGLEDQGLHARSNVGGA